MADGEFTLQEAAAELGVHYMTVYRYVRLGLLDAAKRGGSWRVEGAALDAFREGSERSPVGAGGRAPWAERLEARLIDGDMQGARGVIDKAMSSGAGLDSIYLEVLTPALVRIGERWSEGELDVAVEHRASGIATRLIGQMGPHSLRRGRARGRVILAAPAGERHGLPLLMLGDLLCVDGWEVIDLGADLPTSSLTSMIEMTDDVVAVGLSATTQENLGALEAACRAVRRTASEMLVVVGGRAIRDDEHAVELGASAWASGSEQMGQLIEAHRAGRARH